MPAGYMYEYGEAGAVEDKSKAVEWYRKACDGGSMRCCANLGGLYENDFGDGPKAVEAYRKACDGDFDC